MRPDDTPHRWDLAERKLYDGDQHARHKYGLNVFPVAADDDFEASATEYADAEIAD